MTKVVYNACFGGFGLSEEGVRRYAALKGLTLYPEHDKQFSALGLVTWWTCPPESRNGKMLSTYEWHTATMEQRQASNQFYTNNVLAPRDIARNDPLLVQVVEELGDAANGQHAKLRIEEVPEGGKYRITEYDGFEGVETPESVDWSVA